MAYLELELGTVTPREAEALMALFSVLMKGGNAAPAAVIAPGETAGEPELSSDPQPVAETATSDPTGSAEASPESEKPRRGRPRKASTEPPSTPQPEPPANIVTPEMEAFNHQLAIFNDQMDRGGLSTEKRREAIKVWEAKGPGAIEELKQVIAANDAFLAKKDDAHAKAQQVQEAPKPLTLEQVQDALRSYTVKHDMEASVQLLAKYKCERASNVIALPVDEQIKFMAAANA